MAESLYRPNGSQDLDYGVNPRWIWECVSAPPVNKKDHRLIIASFGYLPTMLALLCLGCTRGGASDTHSMRADSCVICPGRMAVDQECSVTCHISGNMLAQVLLTKMSSKHQPSLPTANHPNSQQL